MLGVEIRLNAYMDEDDVVAEQADEVIVATGSLPPDTGFQKAIPHIESLDGIENANVYSAEAIMARQARPGHRVIVLDEGGNWKGCGTAWKLAEDGHDVTIITPDPLVGKELQRTAADFPLRRTLAGLGVKFVVESAITHWSGTSAAVQSFLDDSKTEILADTLVFATANMAEDSLALALRQRGVGFREIGDGAAPRQAAYAIYEGRKTGLEL